MIYINDKIKIVSHGLDFSIQKEQKVTDHFLAQKENIGADRWINKGYYTTVPWMFGALVDKFNLDEKIVNKLTEIKEKLEVAIESFKQYNIDTNLYHKIIIDEDWSAIGKKMNFIVTRRTTIVEHRFTKQENIGKDKFTIHGYLPQVDLILKDILNEKIIDLAVTEEEVNLDKVNSTIDDFIKNLENLKIKELDENEYVEADENDEDLEDDIAVDEDIDDDIDEEVDSEIDEK